MNNQFVKGNTEICNMKAAVVEACNTIHKHTMELAGHQHHLTDNQHNIHKSLHTVAEKFMGMAREVKVNRSHIIAHQCVIDHTKHSLASTTPLLMTMSG